MYSLNVDFPLRSCTLHLDHCSRRPNKESKYKGFAELKRDGGWLSFATDDEAESLFREQYMARGYRFVRCSYCGA